MSKSASPMFLARMNAGPMSQTELAKKLKVTQSLISRIEKGITRPKLDLARQIAAALGRSVDELFPKPAPKTKASKSKKAAARGEVALEAVS